MFAAVLGGSSAYGGSSESAAPSPIKLGVLTPLTGPFAPWGIQVRAGAALAVNEINRSGGVKGAGRGAAQSRRRGRPVDEPNAANRRLPAADPAGGSRRGRWHHRQRRSRLRPRGSPSRRRSRCSSSRRAQRDPDAVAAATRSVPVCPLPPWSHVGRAVRAAAGDQERGRDRSPTTPGASRSSVARGAVKSAPNIKLNDPGRAGSDDQLHPVPASLRRRVADRCDGPSAGSAAGPGSGGQLGMKAPVTGAYGPWSLTCEGRRARRRTAAGATSSAWPRRARSTRPSRSDTCGRSRRTSSSRTTRWPATRT